MREAIERHLHELCEQIGPRPTGSQANRRAVRYAARELRRLGLNVRMQEFDCVDWVPGPAHLTVAGRPLPVQAAEMSMPCDIEDTFVCVGDMAELGAASAAGDLRGRIAVLHGRLCVETLVPKNFRFGVPDYHRDILDLLEHARPGAVIATSIARGGMVPLIEDGDMDIPCAIVPQGAERVFLRAPQRQAHLRLETIRRPTLAANVLGCAGPGSWARRPGRRPPRIVLTAHIDTKPASPGGLDNASGVAVLLAVAQALTARRQADRSEAPGPPLTRRVEFVMFNGEEYYSVPGETCYARESLADPDDVACVFNVDGVGMVDSSTSYSFYAEGTDLEPRVERAAAGRPGVERIDPWPVGDHMMFAALGVPAVAMTASEFWSAGTIVHGPDDDLTHVDVDRVEQAARFLLACVDAVGDLPARAPRAEMQAARRPERASELASGRRKGAPPDARP